MATLKEFQAYCELNAKHISLTDLIVVVDGWVTWCEIEKKDPLIGRDMMRLKVGVKK